MEKSRRGKGHAMEGNSFNKYSCQIESSIIGQIVSGQDGFCKSFRRLIGLVLAHGQASNTGGTPSLFPTFPRISIQDLMGLGS